MFILKFLSLDHVLCDTFSSFFERPDWGGSRLS
jgi:hypothetical protein